MNTRAHSQSLAPSRRDFLRIALSAGALALTGGLAMADSLAQPSQLEG